MGWALGTVVSERLPLRHGVMRTGAQMLGGGAGLLFVSVAVREPHPPAPPSAPSRRSRADGDHVIWEHLGMPDREDYR